MGKKTQGMKMEKGREKRKVEKEGGKGKGKRCWIEVSNEKNDQTFELTIP